MQKNGNTYLEINKSLNIVPETLEAVNSSNHELEALNTLKIKNSTKNSKQQKINNESDFYDYKHQVTNFIREEVILQHRPPKNSLSELIFNNAIEELQLKLLDENTNPNLTDTIGSTSSWTPLYWGVKLRRIECVQLLLNHGVDINTVVNDCEECCGTVLDLATLRDDEEMEDLLREYAEKEDVNLGQSFKAIRTKLRGKAPAFNFRYYKKNEKQGVEAA